LLQTVGPLNGSGLDVAAVVTPLASRLTTAATRR